MKRIISFVWPRVLVTFLSSVFELSENRGIAKQNIVNAAMICIKSPNMCDVTYFVQL